MAESRRITLAELLPQLDGPTSYLPGSPEKVVLLELRARLGRPLFVPGDSRLRKGVAAVEPDATVIFMVADNGARVRVSALDAEVPAARLATDSKTPRRPSERGCFKVLVP